MKKVKLMKKYAALIAQLGINANSKQSVVISAPVEAYQFVRYLSLALYNCKVKSVSIDWNDGVCQKQKIMHGSISKLTKIPEWIVYKEEERAKENYAKIILEGDDPQLFKSVNGDKFSAYNKAMVDLLYHTKKPYHNNELAWCIAAVPTKAWAKRIFPNMSPTQALQTLWKKIYETCYINEEEDAIDNWEKHISQLDNHAKIMNSYQFKELKYKNSLGTDLSVGLVDNHIWGSARGVQGYNGNYFVPNLPTEEIFSMPHRQRVEGRVCASRPLSFGGVLIEDFWIEFHEGKVVAFDAKVGKSKLEEIINFDDNSSYLGEVALVPYDSPISNQNLIYQSTLFDENASCHLALGASYRENIKDESKYSDEELNELGGNTSKMHCDFMIGTKDLTIDGITKDGKVVPVFRDGNFVF
ncbi:MAG: aminopeptidase [Bacilli bacterium]|nr:aminopeptidase [Bacilli bacterium]